MRSAAFKIEVLMKLSRASCYAVHALIHLSARTSASLVSSHDIAGLLGITENRLVRVLKSLVAARLLWSLRGPGGGYRLARPTSRISLLEVIEAVDGPVHGNVPSLTRSPEEGVERRLKLICQQVAERKRNLLGKIYLSDLLEKRAPIPSRPEADATHSLPPEVAEGLEEIRRLMAAREEDRG
jgi:Rrf2 family protein